MRDARYVGDLGQPSAAPSAADLIGIPNPADTSILEISNLVPSRFNCDRIFNICCLFGNVQKIKFVSDETCLVQMYDASSVNRTIQAMYRKNFFGQKASLMPANTNFLNDDDLFNLQDGTISYSDYFSSPLNRFSEHYTKNRQQYASKTLHYRGVRFK